MDKKEAQRKWKAAERARKKALGLKRGDVWAHPDDWPEIRKIEKDLWKMRNLFYI